MPVDIPYVLSFTVSREMMLTVVFVVLVVLLGLRARK